MLSRKYKWVVLVLVIVLENQSQCNGDGNGEREKVFTVFTCFISSFTKKYETFFS